MNNDEHGADIPGIVLRKSLRPGPHKSSDAHVTRLAWSPDGQLLAVPTQAGAVELWNPVSGIKEGDIDARMGTWIPSVAWSPDGRYIAAGCGDGIARLWVVASGERYLPAGLPRNRLKGTLVAWAPNGRVLATAMSTICQIWDTKSWEADIIDFTGKIASIAFSRSGTLAIAGTTGAIVFWPENDFRPAPKKRASINAFAWSPDNTIYATASSYRTVDIWDAATRRSLRTFEGHTGAVRSVAFSSDGRLLASKSDDGTVRVWDVHTSAPAAALAEPGFGKSMGYTNRTPAGIAFHPSAPVLATLGEEDRGVRIWDLDVRVLRSGAPVEAAVAYTTAKIVLVGDSGVGKTGLGWRLSNGEFKEHSSTHGQQFWVLQELGVIRSDGTECEAVLWDLAGQPDYRLTHVLFLEEVDLALILFDPGNHSDPLRGVEYWIEALRGAGRNTPAKILVAARADRAAPGLTPEEINAFCSLKGITGGFVVTSAKTGQGLPELLDRITAQINWQAMEATVTTATFKQIKDYVLDIKQNENRPILLNPDELEQQLLLLSPNWNFAFDEMMTAVQHLANHGYLSVLRGSSARSSILLSPEILSNLASSVVLEARRNPAGLGALDEARLLHGDYVFPELIGLSQSDRLILIDAVIAVFLERNICFRERLGATTFLIFPSLINQKKPSTEEQDVIDDAFFRITGRVENVYAALVVLLGYTNTFTRTNQWQNQAQYEMNPGEICGFRQVAEREGEIDVVLYYSPSVGSDIRMLFEGLFANFLRGREVTIRVYPAIVCPTCGYRPERSEVVRRINDSKDRLYCGDCGNKIALPAATGATSPTTGTLITTAESARQRTTFEAALARIKAMVRDRRQETSAPTCFISYAWGIERHEKWVVRLAKELRNADVDALLDRKDNAAIGTSIASFVNEVAKSNFVVVVGTPEYLRKYENQDPKSGTFVAAEMDIINVRLAGTRDAKASVMPVLLDGNPNISFPPLLRGRVFADFRSETLYLRSLFGLIVTLHGLPTAEEEVFQLSSSISEAGQA
jgi:small GTP-binding protein